MKMNIMGRKALIAYFLVIIGVALAVFFLAFKTMEKTDKAMHSIRVEYWPAADGTMEVRRTFLRRGRTVLNLFVGDIERAKQVWDEESANFIKMMAQLKTTKLAAEADLAELEEINNEINKLWPEILATTQKQGPETLITSEALKELNRILTLSGPLRVKMEDEIVGKMDKTLENTDKMLEKNRMQFIAFGIAGLVILIGVVLLIIVGLTQLIKKLLDATSQVTSSSSEILASSQEQAAASQEQSAAVSETTSAARELAKSGEQVAESIKRVLDAANQSQLGMSKIKEAIGKTQGWLSSLSEKSKQIGNITELIDDVSDQSNLLAVNAAIEAARAGEQGKGFGVVADEIRKLADSTAKSAKDITSLIELIQHEMSNAVISMEASTNNVNEESKLSQETAERAKEISMSTTQQISGSKQIAEAMFNIDSAMKQVASGAQQAQVAAKQLNGLAGELKTRAESLR